MQSLNTKKGLSCEADYRRTAEGAHYQLIEGQLLHVAESPPTFHQRIVVNLLLLLEPQVRRQGLGEVLVGPVDVVLGAHDVLVPDLVFVSTARIGLITKQGIYGAPDLVVEVLSPSTRQIDQTRKYRTYAAQGVKEYWMIDPDSRAIDLCGWARAPQKPARRIPATGRFTSRLFPGLTIAAADIFRR